MKWNELDREWNRVHIWNSSIQVILMIFPFVYLRMLFPLILRQFDIVPFVAAAAAFPLQWQPKHLSSNNPSINRGKRANAIKQPKEQRTEKNNKRFKTQRTTNKRRYFYCCLSISNWIQNGKKICADLGFGIPFFSEFCFMLLFYHYFIFFRPFVPQRFGCHRNSGMTLWYKSSG